MWSYEKIGIAVLIVAVLFIYVRCSSIKVYRFYRPACPYCVSSQAEWDQFVSDSMFMMIRPININLDKPDNATFAKNFAVTSVPTVIKVNPDGSSEKYDGERTAAAYMKWVRS
jgi:hypothetical protein